MQPGQVVRERRRVAPFKTGRAAAPALSRCVGGGCRVQQRRGARVGKAAQPQVRVERGGERRRARGRLAHLFHARSEARAHRQLHVLEKVRHVFARGVHADREPLASLDVGVRRVVARDGGRDRARVAHLLRLRHARGLDNSTGNNTEY